MEVAPPRRAVRRRSSCRDPGVNPCLSLREVGEFEVIRRSSVQGRGAGAVGSSPPLARGGSRHFAGIVLGSGDDAAVVRPTPLHDLVVTTDAFVEGRHYTDQFEPARVGARPRSRT